MQAGRGVLDGATARGPSPPSQEGSRFTPGPAEPESLRNGPAATGLAQGCPGPACASQATPGPGPRPRGAGQVATVRHAHWHAHLCEGRGPDQSGASAGPAGPGGPKHALGRRPRLASAPGPHAPRLGWAAGPRVLQPLSGAARRFVCAGRARLPARPGRGAGFRTAPRLVHPSVESRDGAHGAPSARRNAARVLFSRGISPLVHFCAGVGEVGGRPGPKLRATPPGTSARAGQTARADDADGVAGPATRRAVPAPGPERPGDEARLLRRDCPTLRGLWLGQAWAVPGGLEHPLHRRLDTTSESAAGRTPQRTAGIGTYGARAVSGPRTRNVTGRRRRNHRDLGLERAADSTYRRTYP
jgi:hypothetical protein